MMLVCGSCGSFHRSTSTRVSHAQDVSCVRVEKQRERWVVYVNDMHIYASRYSDTLMKIYRTGYLKK